MKQVGIYLRVSTTGQTTENQRRGLEAWVARCGHTIVEVYEDFGISGTKVRDKRPAFDAMLKAVTRREIDMIAVWSVDRIARSMVHAVNFIEQLKAVKCDLYIHTMGIDTTTPIGEAFYYQAGIWAQMERAMIVERVNAGLARARAKGKKLGRRRIDAGVEARIRELRAQGLGKIKIAKQLGVGVGTVQRVLA